MVQRRRQTRLTRCLACIMSAILNFYKVRSVVLTFPRRSFSLTSIIPPLTPFVWAPLSSWASASRCYHALLFDIALHDDLKLSLVTAVAVAHPPCSSFMHLLLQRQAFHQYLPQAHPILPPPPTKSTQHRSRLTIPTPTHKTNSLLR